MRDGAGSGRKPGCSLRSSRDRKGFPSSTSVPSDSYKAWRTFRISFLFLLFRGRGKRRSARRKGGGGALFI